MKQHFSSAPARKAAKRILAMAAAGVCLAACVQPVQKGYDVDSVASAKGTEVFKPDWDSIAAHYKFPQWFTDGKFGIFIHWGVYAVSGPNFSRRREPDTWCPWRNITTALPCTTAN